jgi:hypothetical protein
MTRKNRRTRKISFGGATLNLLPTPYHPVPMVEGATNPQSSAMLAQKYANEQQNNINNALDGGDGNEDGLPVVQFSGQNNTKTNEQSVGLTNLIANMRAAGEGDADVTVHR